MQVEIKDSTLHENDFKELASAIGSCKCNFLRLVDCDLSASKLQIFGEQCVKENIKVRSLIPDQWSAQGFSMLTSLQIISVQLCQLPFSWTWIEMNLVKRNVISMKIHNDVCAIFHSLILLPNIHSISCKPPRRNMFQTRDYASAEITILRMKLQTAFDLFSWLNYTSLRSLHFM